MIQHLISKLETVMYEAAATGNKADSGYNLIRLNPRASRKALRLTADEGTRGINLNLCGRLTLLPLVGSVQVSSVVTISSSRSAVGFSEAFHMERSIT